LFAKIRFFRIACGEEKNLIFAVPTRRRVLPNGWREFLLNKTKRYARLVTENVRNFQSHATFIISAQKTWFMVYLLTLESFLLRASGTLTLARAPYTPHCGLTALVRGY